MEGGVVSRYVEISSIRHMVRSMKRTVRMNTCIKHPYPPWQVSVRTIHKGKNKISFDLKRYKIFTWSKNEEIYNNYWYTWRNDPWNSPDKGQKPEKYDQKWTFTKMSQIHPRGPKSVPNHFPTPLKFPKCNFDTLEPFSTSFERSTFLPSGAFLPIGPKTRLFKGFRIWLGQTQNELSESNMIVKASLSIS